MAKELAQWGGFDSCVQGSGFNNHFVFKKMKQRINVNIFDKTDQDINVLYNS